MANPIILVDSNNLCYRSHFAHKGLADSQGRATGTIYGFLRALLKLREYSDRIVFLWDNGAPFQQPIKPWRKYMFADYKANREPTKDTESVHLQMPILADVLAGLGYMNFTIPGMEADDLCGLLVWRTEDNFLIYSNDEDMYQLLDKERVRILAPEKKGGFKVLTEMWFQGEYNIYPKDWITVKALGGCTTDNVKPIPGIGQGTAIKWVRDLGVCIDNKTGLGIREWDEAVVEKIQEHYEAVQLAYELVRIPQTLSDTRFGNLINKPYQCFINDKALSAYQRDMSDQETKMEVFTRFCAEYDMADLLDRRWNFFRKREIKNGHDDRE